MIYFGPYRWIDSDGDPRWELPPGCHAGVDLRNNQDVATAGGAANGTGLFWCDANPGADWRRLGEPDDPTQPAFADRFNLQSVKLGNAVLEMLTRRGDPTGDARFKPISPNRQRLLRVNLGPWSNAVKFDVARDTLVLDAIKRRYLKVREASLAGKLIGPNGEVDLDKHRRVLKFMARKYGIHPSVIHPTDDPLTPQTTVSDDFNRADSNNDLGANWEFLESTWDIASNAAVPDSGNPGSARYETDLSGDDHKCQVDVTTDSDSLCGPLCRMQTADTTTDTYYFGAARQIGTSDFFALRRVVSGSVTTVASSTETVTNHTLRLEVDGSDLELFVDGGSKLTGTDSNITGNLRCGMAGKGGDILDNWSAEDIAAAVAANYRTLLGVGT